MLELKRIYRERERQIKNRLKDFSLMKYRGDREVFAELCFCLLTPGSKAEKADEAIRKLTDNGLLFTGSQEEIAPYLRGVRFFRQKAERIVRARGFSLKELKGDVRSKRIWLVENVKGLGWKEASHFLRNIGEGEEIAIIDRHILKNLVEHGFLEGIPKTITKKRYLELEEIVRSFSKELGISMAELDLLLWSKETGKVFK